MHRLQRTPLGIALLFGLSLGAASLNPAFAQRDRDPPSANQIADRVDARVAKLKADLNLNDDQSKNWGAVQTALHDIGIARVNRYFQRDGNDDSRRDANSARDPNAPRDSADRDRSRMPDEIDRMRKQADLLTDRAADLRKLADAAGPLYGTLDDGQKRRFVEFLRRDRDDDRESMREERRGNR